MTPPLVFQPVSDENESPPDPEALLADLLEAQGDIGALAGRHGVPLRALSRWAQLPETRKAVSGLCLLSDMQAQLTLSRYRLHAASRLVGQATSAEGELAPEQVRKACVDVLKMELDRAALAVGEDENEEDPALVQLRAAVDEKSGLKG